jgi:hypothetical protein
MHDVCQAHYPDGLGASVGGLTMTSNGCITAVARSGFFRRLGVCFSVATVAIASQGTQPSERTGVLLFLARGSTCQPYRYS